MQPRSFVPGPPTRVRRSGVGEDGVWLGVHNVSEAWHLARCGLYATYITDIGFAKAHCLP